VIWVTRLNGSEIVVNADLIEVVESTPDTVLTLVDGKKYVVHESAEEVVNRIRAYRASILREADTPRRPHEGRAAANLYVLPTGDGDEG
jgi:flagellar protein FlbD